MFLSLAAITNVPGPLWRHLATLRPRSIVAKLAILFAAWHVAVIIWLFFYEVMEKAWRSRGTRERSMTPGVDEEIPHSTK